MIIPHIRSPPLVVLRQGCFQPATSPTRAQSTCSDCSSPVRAAPPASLTGEGTVPGRAAQGDGDARHPGTAAARAGDHDHVEEHAGGKVRPEGPQHDAALRRHPSLSGCATTLCSGVISRTDGRLPPTPRRVPTPKSREVEDHRTSCGRQSPERDVITHTYTQGKAAGRVSVTRSV